MPASRTNRYRYAVRVGAIATAARDRYRIVVWFFERSGAFVRFESRAVEQRGDLFELVIVQPDGTEKIEYFKDSDALMQRQLQLERTLAHDGWQGPFGRIF